MNRIKVCDNPPTDIKVDPWINNHFQISTFEKLLSVFEKHNKIKYVLINIKDNHPRNIGVDYKEYNKYFSYLDQYAIKKEGDLIYLRITDFINYLKIDNHKCRLVERIVLILVDGHFNKIIAISLFDAEDFNIHDHFENLFGFDIDSPKFVDQVMPALKEWNNKIDKEEQKEFLEKKDDHLFVFKRHDYTHQNLLQLNLIREKVHHININYLKKFIRIIKGYRDIKYLKFNHKRIIEYLIDTYPDHFKEKYIEEFLRNESTKIELDEDCYRYGGNLRVEYIQKTDEFNRFLDRLMLEYYDLGNKKYYLIPIKEMQLKFLNSKFKEILVMFISDFSNPVIYSYSGKIRWKLDKKNANGLQPILKEWEKEIKEKEGLK